MKQLIEAIVISINTRPGLHSVSLFNERIQYNTILYIETRMGPIVSEERAMCIELKTVLSSLKT